MWWAGGSPLIYTKEKHKREFPRDFLRELISQPRACVCVCVFIIYTCTRYIDKNDTIKREKVKRAQHHYVGVRSCVYVRVHVCACVCACVCVRKRRRQRHQSYSFDGRMGKHSVTNQIDGLDVNKSSMAGLAAQVQSLESKYATAETECSPGTNHSAASMALRANVFSITKYRE